MKQFEVTLDDRTVVICNEWTHTAEDAKMWFIEESLEQDISMDASDFDYIQVRPLN
jgi:hypothetical protein